jgi:hypothetical protein
MRLESVEEAMEAFQDEMQQMQGISEAIESMAGTHIEQDEQQELELELQALMEIDKVEEKKGEEIFKLEDMPTAPTASVVHPPAQTQQTESSKVSSLVPA